MDRFIPEFLKWTLPSLNLGTSIIANRGLSKLNNSMTNREDPDETARYVSSGSSLLGKECVCLQG